MMMDRGDAKKEAIYFGSSHGHKTANQPHEECWTKGLLSILFIWNVWGELKGRVLPSTAVIDRRWLLLSTEKIWKKYTATKGGANHFPFPALKAPHWSSNFSVYKGHRRKASHLYFFLIQYFERIILWTFDSKDTRFSFPSKLVHIWRLKISKSSRAIFSF